MKEKILYLILGILIGAVITAGCFLVFSKANKPNGIPGDMPNSEMMRERPSEMPNSNNEVENSEVIPEENI